MDNNVKIAEIKKLSEELKYFKQERNMYKQLESELKKMAEQVEILRNRKKEIDLRSVKEEIQKLENEYERTFLEIDRLTMKEKDCLNIKDLEIVYKNFDDNNQCMEKVFKYLETLIISHKLDIKNLNNGFKRSNSEEGIIVVIKISQDVESVFKLSEKKKFFPKLVLEWRSLLKRELEENVARDCSFYKSKNYVYIVVRGDIKINDYDEIGSLVHFEKVNEINVNIMADDMGKAWNIIFLVLKDNLGKKMIKDSYNLEQIKENNEIFRGSEWHIVDLEEWILDILMKNILRMPMKNKTIDEWCEKSRENKRMYTENYNQIMNCLKLFKEIKSNRKPRAREKIESVIFGYFKSDCTENLNSLFFKYAELTDFIKKYKKYKYFEEFKYLKKLEDEKENTFSKIIKIATYIEIDLIRPPLILKSEIRTLLFDFMENVNYFIESLEIKTFINLFFKELYGNLFELALKPKKYTIQEKNCFCDVAEYTKNLSYEYNLQNVKEYDKLTQCLQIISSTIEDIENKYKKELTKLNKYELRTIIRMFFDKGDKRDSFLDKIY